LSISARTHVSIFYLPYFLIFRLTLIFNKERGRIIVGKVVEKGTNLPISRVNVHIYSADAKTKVASLITNKLGEFYYRNRQAKDYTITVSKKGFDTSSPYKYVNSKVESMPTIFEIKKQGEIKHSPFEIFLVYTEDLLGLCMEAFVLLGLLIQVYFIFTFGFLRVAPFILLTIFNIFLIFSFLYKPKSLEA
jgi:hypothetical protein